MMISLREKLQNIRKRDFFKENVRLPSSFHSLPWRQTERGKKAITLRELISFMELLQPEEWERTRNQQIKKRTWTSGTQGLTTDGTYWFISKARSLDPLYSTIRKMDQNFKVLKRVKIEREPHGRHLGDIDFFEGRIYGPLERTSKVIVFDTNLNVKRIEKLKPMSGKTALPQGNSFPWCAIHPWNKHLYSSSFDNVSQVHAYHLKDFSHVATLELGKTLNRVQGGCISKNGHLYLSSDDREGDAGIHAFSLLNGAYLGKRSVAVDHRKVGKSYREEVEGIAIWPPEFDQKHGHIHLILLQVIASDLYLKSFTLPDPSRL